MQSSLAHPTWDSLNGYYAHLNEGSEQVRYFPADISPFITMEQWTEAGFDLLRNQIPPNRSFYVLLDREMDLSPWCQVVATVPAYRMACIQLRPQYDDRIAIQSLDVTHVPQMMALTAATKPGPFEQRTIHFGNYVGIMDNNQLVSMAGQRLQTYTHTEVSAICTNPNYLGRGYAGILTTHVCNKILKVGKTPFLHLRQDNTGALHLYKKLGFEIVREILFYVIKKK